MKTSELINRLARFRDDLKAHFDLWCQSLDRAIPEHPVRNRGELQEQQKALFRQFYLLDPFLFRLSKARLMNHPATGQRWDIYRSAIGNDTAPIKGPSAQNALLELEGIIALLSSESPDSQINPLAVATNSPKRVFISHGRESAALTKTERFLRGLGLTPVIVKNEPSLGKSLDDLVEEQMASCECAIALATKDDEVGGAFQPRPNVIHEIGLGQEKLNGRLIYLKEEGCSFPSNIAPKVWENFSQDNMEGAFTKIVKELRGFGVIG